MENSEDKRSTCLSVLPEGCVAEILSLTSPLDVCRLSLVSKSVRSAAESDSVWDKFLPSDYQSIISGSLSPIPDFRSKKDLYAYLCQHPLLIDGGRKSFSLEKWTGKKCYFLGARDLKIVWSDTPKYWKWTSLPESRFPEVTKLKLVWWLEISGTIRAGVLSPLTSYTAYFVYKLEDEVGFDERPAEVSVGVSGVELENRFAFLTPDGELQQDDDDEESVYTLSSDAEEEPRLPGDDDEVENEPGPHNLQEDAPSLVQSDIQLPKLRDDGWFEVELGVFFSENEDDCIEMSMKEVKGGFQKRGLIVEGIEIRPKGVNYHKF